MKIKVITMLLALSTMFLNSCALFKGASSLTPAQVQWDVSLAVTTVESAASFNPLALVAVKGFLQAAHLYFTVGAGATALPAVATVEADLNNLVAQLGNSSWAQSVAHSLVLEYQKIYTSIQNAAPYIAALAAGTANAIKQLDKMGVKSPR